MTIIFIFLHIYLSLAQSLVYFKNQIDAGNLRMIFASLQDKAEALATKKVRFFMNYDDVFKKYF